MKEQKIDKLTLIKFDVPNWVQGFMSGGKRYFHPYLRNDFVFDHQKEENELRRKKEDS